MTAKEKRELEKQRLENLRKCFTKCIFVKSASAKEEDNKKGQDTE